MTNNVTLWFHKVNDNNWDINSYEKIIDIESIDDFLYTYKKLGNFTSGMFFLMKTGIKPVYEDINNINGGVFTFKISKKLCKFFWLEISYLFILKQLTIDIKNDNYLTGLSISPKTNNCIIKIWTNTYNNLNVNIFKNNIEYLYLNDAIFRKN
jgi:hypothetical protein